MGRKILISILLFFSFVTGVSAQQTDAPKYEYRAVWLTTLGNLDWPKTHVQSPSDIDIQKKELILILDSLQRLHINTVLLQTRVRGDLIIESDLEPYSHVFTGESGKAPGYDPLAFAIEECHKRGMQLHAWFVTFPLGNDDHIKRLGNKALPKRNPALCTHYKDSWYLEPGNPEAAGYLTALVMEIVKNYDVDGIHFDYVRYPDQTNGYPDASLYRKYGKGRSLADWRRNNITHIVESIYKAVKEHKPWVRVSCSPLGKFRSLTRYSSYGWDAYSAVFQDAQGWMRKGIMDILFPMLYYKGKHFYPFVLDWCENSHGRHVVPGLGIYQLLPEYGAWEPIEIVRQMRTSRRVPADGFALFRTAHFMENSGGARDAYSSVCNTPALVPPMSWACEPPSAPSSFHFVRDEKGVTMQWNSVEAPEGFPAMRYNVYAALGDSVDVSRIENLLVSSLDTLAYRWECRSLKSLALAVTAVNAYGVESSPVTVCVPAGGALSCRTTLSLPSSLTAAERIEIVDLYGHPVCTDSFTSEYNVENLSPGVYTLNVSDSRGVVLYSRRFIR